MAHLLLCTSPEISEKARPAPTYAVRGLASIRSSLNPLHEITYRDRLEAGQKTKILNKLHGVTAGHRTISFGSLLDAESSNSEFVVELTILLLPVFILKIKMTKTEIH